MFTTQVLKERCQELEKEYKSFLEEIQGEKEKRHKESIINKIQATAKQIKIEFEENEMGNKTKDYYKTLLYSLNEDVEKLRNMVSYFYTFYVRESCFNYLCNILSKSE